MSVKGLFGLVLIELSLVLNISFWAKKGLMYGLFSAGGGGALGGGGGA